MSTIFLNESLILEYVWVCRKIVKSSHILHSQFPLLLTSYVSMTYVPELMS